MSNEKNGAGDGILPESLKDYDFTKGIDALKEQRIAQLAELKESGALQFDAVEIPEMNPDHSFPYAANSIEYLGATFSYELAGPREIRRLNEFLFSVTEEARFVLRLALNNNFPMIVKGALAEASENKTYLSKLILGKKEKSSSGLNDSERAAQAAYETYMQLLFHTNDPFVREQACPLSVSVSVGNLCVRTAHYNIFSRDRVAAALQFPAEVGIDRVVADLQDGFHELGMVVPYRQMCEGVERCLAPIYALRGE